MIDAQLERAYLEPPEPKMSRLRCYECGEQIPCGGTYYLIDGIAYCENCIKDAREYADEEDLND
ncbi:MAG: hypothetical protein VB078_00250 [Clostridiaceae bacterium]|nr:hypothetical protein [Clostridiaceae bacterium]